MSQQPTLTTTAAPELLSSVNNRQWFLSPSLLMVSSKTQQSAVPGVVYRVFHSHSVSVETACVVVVRLPHSGIACSTGFFCESLRRT
jgi:hypothetical protein